MSTAETDRFEGYGCADDAGIVIDVGDDGEEGFPDGLYENAR
jgi:hypothetical protein